MKKRRFFYTFVVSIFLATASSNAQEYAAGPSTIAELKFTKIQCVDSNGKTRQNNRYGPDFICKIGDRIESTVTGLGAWLEDTENEYANLVLALDGQMLTGLTAGQPANGDAATIVLFYLIHTDENRKDWQKILVRATFTRPKAMTLSIVEIGTVNTYGTAKILMNVTSFWPAGVMVVLYASLVAGFYVWVRKGSLLRDAGPAPKSGDRPYSLGAAQMAFWFFIIFAGFLYVWLMTSALDSLTASVLGLAGISAGTGLAATAIGASKMTEAAKKRTELEIEKKRWDDKKKAYDAKKLVDQDFKIIEQITTRLREIGGEITLLPPEPKPSESQGFFKDILISEGHVTFSRFQMLAWTVVLGIIFIHTVYTTLAMPEFNATLLALMGVSSSAYVGFKFPQAPNG